MGSRSGQGERIDAILCGAKLLDMSGVDFHRAVQRAAPHLGARVAFVTGGELDDATEALEGSGLPYIGTSIEPSMLRALVQRLVED